MWECRSNIVNQLLASHSPLTPLGQVDEWTAKPSRFQIQGSLSELSRIVAVKTLKKSVSLTDSEVQTFLEGEKTIYQKINRKLSIQWLWCWHFSRLRMKIVNWKICHWPILAVYLKDFFLSLKTKSINENFLNWKLRPLLFL